MAAKRFNDEPAYVLHRYDWSESSLILEVFTRHQGRIALVARGAKKPSSSFRPVLLPLQPLHLSFGGDTEVRNLKSAEWQGGHVMPTGEALMSGYYLNELLIRLLARDDPHPRLFDGYAATVQLLATPGHDTLQLALRAFELWLLRETGFLPALDVQTATLMPLEDAVGYVLVPESGLREAHENDRGVLSGVQWCSLQRSMADGASFVDTLHAATQVASELKVQLRALLHYHCDVPMLKTRQMMRDLQAL